MCIGNLRRLCLQRKCKTCFSRSFASSPKAKYWSKRNLLKPWQVFLNCGKKFWFDCPECEHEFDIRLDSVNNGQWCSYCANQKLCPDENCQLCHDKSFAVSDKAQYWSQRNTKTPREVFLNCHTKCWFDCTECGHEFNTKLANINIGRWCPYCANQKLCPDENCQLCHDKSFAASDKAQYWSQHNEKTPREVFSSSDKKCWFDCPECEHEFDIQLSSVKRGRWCPYCSYPPQKLCDDEDCQLCHEKSFAFSDKAQYWSQRNTKTPREVFLNCNENFWFDCPKCEHEFDISLGSVNRGGWCQYCANQKLCPDENCQLCHDKSFAASDKAQYWSNRNKKTAREVFLNSGAKCWFDCPKCEHDFNARSSNINKGIWCPYCSYPPKKLCPDENCQLCHDKSFAFSDKAQYWSQRNTKTPREVFLNCNEKFWFKCENNHEFITPPSSITGKGSWCPKCKNKSETLLLEYLETIFPAVIHQFKADWTKLFSKTRLHHLPYDFCIEDEKLIIELDGDQHFVQVSNWKAPEITAKTDSLKNRLAVINGYSVIRLLQTDVLNDENDWQDKLDVCIEYIRNQPTRQIMEMYNGEIRWVKYITNLKFV